MMNSDLYVCLFNNNGAVHVLDLFSAQRTWSASPPNDTAIGGTYDVLVNILCLMDFYSVTSSKANQSQNNF